MLEDLLKKLPGVEVNDDGSVTVNGETVKKITIEGKTKGQIGVSANLTKTKNEAMHSGVETSYDNNVINWAPQASFSCDPDKMISIISVH